MGKPVSGPVRPGTVTKLVEKFSASSSSRASTAGDPDHLLQGCEPNVPKEEHHLGIKQPLNFELFDYYFDNPTLHDEFSPDDSMNPDNRPSGLRDGAHRATTPSILVVQPGEVATSVGYAGHRTHKPGEVGMLAEGGGHRLGWAGFWDDLQLDKNRLNKSSVPEQNTRRPFSDDLNLDLRIGAFTQRSQGDVYFNDNAIDKNPLKPNFFQNYLLIWAGEPGEVGTGVAGGGRRREPGEVATATSGAGHGRSGNAKFELIDTFNPLGVETFRHLLYF